MPTHAKSTNTGRKDNKNRSIWKGPKGGLYVMSGGKKIKPAMGHKKMHKTPKRH